MIAMHSRLEQKQILPYKQSYFKKHLDSDYLFSDGGVAGPAGTRRCETSFANQRCNEAILRIGSIALPKANEHNCRKARHPSASGATFYPAHAQGTADYFPAGNAD